VHYCCKVGGWERRRPGRMRWERVRVKHKVKEIPDGKKTPGRKGGTAGPGQKWGHTCNTVKSGRFIYVFGGYGKDECQTQDIHVFDCGENFSCSSCCYHPQTQTLCEAPLCVIF
jgi:hypothetical protein